MSSTSGISVGRRTNGKSRRFRVTILTRHFTRLLLSDRCGHRTTPSPAGYPSSTGLTRDHRRFDPRRGHPWSPRAQCLSDRAIRADNCSRSWRARGRRSHFLLVGRGSGGVPGVSALATLDSRRSGGQCPEKQGNLRRGAIILTPPPRPSIAEPEADGRGILQPIVFIGGPCRARTGDNRIKSPKNPFLNQLLIPQHTAF